MAIETPSFRLEELVRDATHLTSAFGNVAILQSAGTPESSYLERQARAINAVGARYPAGMGFLVIIAADEPPPDEPTRRAIQACFTAMKPSIRAGVLVVEGEGFAASVKRSVVAVLSMSGATPFRVKPAGTVREGADKLVKLLGPALAPGLDAQQIATAANEARRLLAESLTFGLKG